MGLKTQPLLVGRSGQTADGRSIKPEWLMQAAKNYNRDTFTAVIWPEHERNYNLGLVDSVELRKNAQGGVDLFAVLEPNEYYRINVTNGQKLFASIEITENFAGTGEAYLTGLGATDQPASLGTQPIQFRQQPNPGVFASNYIEAAAQSDDEPTSWLKKLFFNSKPEPQDIDMTPQELQAMFAAQTTAITTAISQAFSAKPSAPTADQPLTKTDLVEAFAQLNKPAKPEFNDDAPLTVGTMKELFKQLKQGETPSDDEPLTVASFKKLLASGKLTDDCTQFSNGGALAELQQQLADLTEKFAQATKAKPGTSGGKHTGDTVDLDDYV